MWLFDLSLQLNLKDFGPRERRRGLAHHPGARVYFDMSMILENPENHTTKQGASNLI